MYTLEKQHNRKFLSQGLPEPQNHLSINTRCNEIEVDDLHLRLPPQEFALVSVYAQARTESWRGAGINGIGDNHRGWILTDTFIDTTKRTYNPFHAFVQAYEIALKYRDPEPVAALLRLFHTDPFGLQQFFQRKRSLLDKTLREAGATYANIRLKAVLEKPHRAGLLIAPERIKFIR